MSRQYSAQDVIGLPRMKAPAALGLGEALLAAAEQHGAPKSAQRALARLVDAQKALGAVLVDESPQRVSNPEAVKTDRAVDNAWAALHLWLSGWSRLEVGAENASATAALNAIFPDGLAFTQRTFAEEWGESEVRLQRIARDWQDLLGSLGGAPFLKTLRAAHRAYGEALNITAASAATPAPPQRRAALDEFLGALRGYVLKVAAHAEGEDDTAQAHVAQLLLPLSQAVGTQAETPRVEGVPTPAPADPTR
jgi:hypothetical protein